MVSLRIQPFLFAPRPPGTFPPDETSLAARSKENSCIRGQTDGWLGPQHCKVFKIDQLPQDYY